MIEIEKKFYIVGFTEPSRFIFLVILRNLVSEKLNNETGLVYLY